MALEVPTIVATLAVAVVCGGITSCSSTISQSVLDTIIVPSQQRSQYLDNAIRAYRLAWNEFDSDGDGALNRSEWAEKQWSFYLIHDEDLDGQLNLNEWISATCPDGRPPDEVYEQCRRFYAQEFFSHERDGFLQKEALSAQSLKSLLHADVNRNVRIEKSEYFVRN